VIIEDIYGGLVGKYATFFFDNLFNLEFFGHPHSNKSDEEWKKCFKKIRFFFSERRQKAFDGVF